MWIARDKDESLWLYKEKPIGKDSCRWLLSPNSVNELIILNEDWFPEVKWEDEEPRELVLKPIKEE